MLPCLLAPYLIPALCEKSGAQERAHKEPPTPGPMLAQGRITLDTPEFTLDLVRSSQTVAGLKPKAAPEFDFTPGDLLVERSDRKSTCLNSSHRCISYAVFCLKKKKINNNN